MATAAPVSLWARTLVLSQRDTANASSSNASNLRLQPGIFTSLEHRFNGLLVSAAVKFCT
jgi:hypothetical protein